MVIGADRSAALNRRRRHLVAEYDRRMLLHDAPRPAGWATAVLLVCAAACSGSSGVGEGALPRAVDDPAHVLIVTGDTAPPRVSSAQAVSIALEGAGAEGATVVIARRRIAMGDRPTGWIVLYTRENWTVPCGGPPGGPLRPGTPRRLCAITHHGSFVDDQTGEQLYSFSLGTHVDEPGATLVVTDESGAVAWFRIFADAADAY
jgi:hypothetical protein